MNSFIEAFVFYIMLYYICKFNIECTKKVMVKVHLYKKGNMGSLDEKLETRRIKLEGTESALFRNFKIALIKECKGLGLEEGNFKIYWEDCDADLIIIDNAYGFHVALEETQGPVHKIIVLLKNNEDGGKFRFTFICMITIYTSLNNLP